MAGADWDLVRRAVALRPATRVSDPVSARAAVALVMRERASGLELLFIRRAELEHDPWSGHMGFPGGRAEPGETDLLTTAVRETMEETGLDLRGEAECLAPIDEIRALARGRPVDLAITPFVFRLQPLRDGSPSPEVVSLHWLSLDRLLDPGSRNTMEYEHEGTVVRLPCLDADGIVIWGLTYRMFDNFRLLLEAARA